MMTIDDRTLFLQSISGTKKLVQDTVQPKKQRFYKRPSTKKVTAEKSDLLFYFSDEYQPLLKENPIRYLKESADPDELKKLKKGFYLPELFLDLHGLTQNEAKQEIAELIYACLHKDIECASIMYGHGKNILKKQTPRWLAQHPDILAFHQAPRSYGGEAALFVLFDVKLDDKI